MRASELMETVQFVVDAEGKKKAVMLDYAVWEEVMTLLEDREDSAEMRRLREIGDEAIPWDLAKQELRAEGIDV